MVARPTPATAIEAAVEVLRTANAPLTVDDIWAMIETQRLWRPPHGGRSPRQTLAVQMARASEGYEGSRPTRTKLFKRLKNGSYVLLTRSEAL